MALVACDACVLLAVVCWMLLVFECRLLSLAWYLIMIVWCCWCLWLCGVWCLLFVAYYLLYCVGRKLLCCLLMHLLFVAC